MRHPLRSLRRLVASALGLAAVASAAPLSRHTEIDFFRDIPSRSLQGLATRSDGRLVSGPFLTELTGPAPADLLWCLEPAGNHTWLAGSGPDGAILEFTLAPSSASSAPASFTSRTWAKLDDSQVFALHRLADGSVLAGTSPQGRLALLRDGKVVSSLALPVDSVFDILYAPGASEALVATGNPGRIYAVDLARFAQAGIVAEKLTDPALLADRGIRLWGKIRDRNVRRLARVGDRVIAGSSPKGNLYAFPAASPDRTAPLAPVILQENRDAEVTDLLAAPDGGFYATFVFSGSPDAARINPLAKGAKITDDDATPDVLSPVEKFTGRSSLLYFPAAGFPETLTTRNGAGFYRLTRHNDTLVLAGGDQGELLGFDLIRRVALTFPGSASAQLNDLAPLPGAPGRFLLLRNNAPGLALLDFTAAGPRQAETRRIDLGAPAALGALRFNRLRALAPDQLTLELRTSNGTDEVEGWSPWTSLLSADGGWRARATPRGRYIKLRLHLPATAAFAEIDKAALYSLPQNHRPQLADFRVFSPNVALIPQPDPAPSPTATLGQIMNASGGNDKDRRRDTLMASQLVPAPGNQLVVWNVTDPDNDELAYTFSLRRDGDSAWTDLALATTDSYVQFDFSHLPEGLYFTRLTAAEQAPRAAADRLSTTFETDDLVIDRTPPEILDAHLKREGDRVLVSVHGRDALSLLEALEVNFNHGLKETVEQPADGILDGQEETFILELPAARVAGATSVEVILYDAPGNSTSRRLSVQP